MEVCDCDELRLTKSTSYVFYNMVVIILVCFITSHEWSHKSVCHMSINLALALDGIKNISIKN